MSTGPPNPKTTKKIAGGGSIVLTRSELLDFQQVSTSTAKVGRSCSMPAHKSGGFTMTKASRQWDKRASLNQSKRSAAVVDLAFFSRLERAPAACAGQILCRQSCTSTQEGSEEIGAVRNEDIQSKSACPWARREASDVVIVAQL